MVSTRADPPYRGGRSKDWIKVKNRERCSRREALSWLATIDRPALYAAGVLRAISAKLSDVSVLDCWWQLAVTCVNALASFLVLAHQIVQEMRFRKITFILSALATIATPVSSRGDDGVDTSYEACSTACVATAHKCLDQITVDLSQRRADRIRTQCGETLDGCVTACQDSAANAFQKSHPTIIGSPPH